MGVAEILFLFAHMESCVLSIGNRLLNLVMVNLADQFLEPVQEIGNLLLLLTNDLVTDVLLLAEDQRLRRSAFSWAALNPAGVVPSGRRKSGDTMTQASVT